MVKNLYFGKNPYFRKKKPKKFIKMKLLSKIKYAYSKIIQKLYFGSC